MVNLSVKIGKLKLKNPVMAGSGTFGPEYGDLTDINSLGAYIAKTITLKPRIGNPPPRLIETPSGMINSIGLENSGVDDFINNKLPKLRNIKIPIIVSIAAETDSELSQIMRKLKKVKEVDAIELNLSCPNIKHGNRKGLIAQDAKATASAVKALKRSTSLTVIAKLSPNVTDIGVIARCARDGGADAISLVNTFFAMAVDIDTGRPALGNITGGLSGPAIKPLALKLVYEASKAVDIPIIGMGGIMDYKDAIEFMLCGASAVQVGTANFVDPDACRNIVDGIKRYMLKNKISDVKKLTGKLKI